MEITNEMTSRDILLVFGGRIRDYRIRLNMTQRELADISIGLKMAARKTSH